MLNRIVSMIEILAIWGAGVASLFGSYEPKMPDCLLENEEE